MNSRDNKFVVSAGELPRRAANTNYSCGSSAPDEAPIPHVGPRSADPIAPGASTAPSGSQAIYTKLLTSKHEIDAARTLLLGIYNKELGWSPPEGNPSGQRISRLASGELGLVDQYDYTCTWIGLMDNGHVVGCVRLIESQPGGLGLELENYFDVPAPLLKTTGSLIEVNRLAIEPGYRHGLGIRMIANHVLSVAQSLGKSLIATVTSASAGCALRYVGMTDTGLRFKYHPDDPEDAAVFVLPPDAGMANSVHL